jgi:hypothetical protein
MTQLRKSSRKASQPSQFAELLSNLADLERNPTASVIFEGRLAQEVSDS